MEWWWSVPGFAVVFIDELRLGKSPVQAAARGLLFVSVWVGTLFVVEEIGRRGVIPQDLAGFVAAAALLGLVAMFTWHWLVPLLQSPSSRRSD